MEGDSDDGLQPLLKFKNKFEDGVGSYKLQIQNQQKKPHLQSIIDWRGRISIDRKNYSRRIYFEDIYRTLVDVRTDRFLILFLMMFFLDFLLFAWIYQSTNYHVGKEGEKVLCLPGCRNFIQTFWFSVQSSMALGFGGTLIPDPRCTAMNVFITIHSLIAVVRTSILLSLFYSRFSKPSKKISYILFSDKMVVTPRNGDFPILSARVANVRKGQILEARVRMLCCVGNCKFFEIPLIKSRLFLAVPDVVQHQLNHKSPLYEKVKEWQTSEKKEEMEILILLEGIDSSTSSTIQVCKSYKFENFQFSVDWKDAICISSAGRRYIDFQEFHETYRVYAPLCWTPTDQKDDDDDQSPPSWHRLSIELRHKLECMREELITLSNFVMEDNPNSKEFAVSCYSKLTRKKDNV